MADYKFEGWMAFDKDAANGGMKWQEFEPKRFEETDVDVKISHCGICGTDGHTLRSGWFPTDYPTCVGHEMVGTIVKVGAKAEGDLKLGQVVGIGSQIGCCLDCEDCNAGRENYCPKLLQTYNSRYPTGEKTYGGFAKYWRGPARWVFKLPEGMSPAEAGPMLCAGITVYAPLKNNGCGPGKRVGVIGIGGLGHLGVLFAKALGADKVVAISRSKNKRDDAMQLGADDYIATEEENDWVGEHGRSLDLIISTIANPKMPLAAYLTLLRSNGSFVQLGAPEDTLPALNAFSLIPKGLKLCGSMVGPPAQIREMLDFAVAHDVHPIIQERPMKEANEAVMDMDMGKARYRYVLVNPRED